VTSLSEPGREQLYVAEKLVGGGVNRWAVRTAGDPAQIAGAVRAAVAEVDRQFLINELEPMDTIVRRSQAHTRFTLALIALFAVIAALLVSVGLYGARRRA
jgi:hypothetical protein